jgi:Flp pilus assembly protein TadD
VLVYWPVRHHDFVAYDDPSVVSENLTVQAGLTWAGVRWALTTTQTGNWHPLTWLSHMLDCQLFGMHPGAHHLVSVAWHAANALLLFLLVRLLTGALWPSAIVAALFAWHPLRVESVAWAAERKDVLCAFFALLTLVAYVRYARTRSPGETPGAARSLGGHVTARRPSLAYALALTSFALGLLAKPMLVTLPFVMLLLDFWPLARLSGRQSPPAASSPGWPAWRGLLVEKWPFFALSAGFCGVALWAQARSEALLPLARYPLAARLQNPPLAYVVYLLKTVYPVDLAYFYPPPKVTSWLATVGAGAVLAGLSWAAWHLRRRKPCLLAGWLWFVGMLVPVIGVVQVGDQFVADRYTYLPSIGLGLGVVFALADVVIASRAKVMVWGCLAVLMLAGCLWATTRQLRSWRDSAALFSHAVGVTRDNSVALTNLGALLLKQGQVEDAIDRFRQAAEIAPANDVAQNNLGLALARRGRFDEAVAHYQRAVALNPRYLQAYENLGAALLQAGHFEQAIASLQQATALQPSDARAFNDLGVALMRSGHAPEALSAFQKAVDLEPSSARFRNNLGNALLQLGRADEARLLLTR